MKKSEVLAILRRIKLDQFATKGSLPMTKKMWRAGYNKAAEELDTLRDNLIGELIDSD